MVEAIDEQVKGQTPLLFRVSPLKDDPDRKIQVLFGMLNKQNALLLLVTNKYEYHVFKLYIVI